MSKLTRKQALMIRELLKAKAAEADDNYTAQNPFVLEKWTPGVTYNAGDRIQHNGKPYKVIQSHTAQTDWEPELTPALFVEISFEEWPEWKQPSGTHDAYNRGDKVSFQGNHYISLLDGNVWSPAAYPAGWQQQ